MITAAQIRSIRAYRDETQEQFGGLIGLTRYEVHHLEKYGLSGKPDLESKILALSEGQHADSTGVAADGG